MNPASSRPHTPDERRRGSVQRFASGFGLRDVPFGARHHVDSTVLAWSRIRVAAIVGGIAVTSRSMTSG